MNGPRVDGDDDVGTALAEPFEVPLLSRRARPAQVAGLAAMPRKARRGVAAIAEKFRALEAEGPTWVAAFLGQDGGEPRERARVDAFLIVQEVLRLVG